MPCNWNVPTVRCLVEEINQDDKKSPESAAEVEWTALEEAERSLTLVEVERMLNFNRDTVVSNGVLESAKEAPKTYKGTSEIHQEVTWTDTVTFPAFEMAQLGLTPWDPSHVVQRDAQSPRYASKKYKEIINALRRWLASRGGETAVAVCRQLRSL